MGDWGPFHFRELTPKDFYFAQILRQEEVGYMPLVLRLLKNEDALDDTPVRVWRKVLQWCVDTLLDQHVLTVENWLEVSFHLCKQRWDQSVDWLETQPMSKVLLMIDIVKKTVEREQDEAKKAARRSSRKK